MRGYHGEHRARNRAERRAQQRAPRRGDVPWSIEAHAGPSTSVGLVLPDLPDGRHPEARTAAVLLGMLGGSILEVGARLGHVPPPAGYPVPRERRRGEPAVRWAKTVEKEPVTFARCALGVAYFRGDRSAWGALLAALVRALLDGSRLPTRSADTGGYTATMMAAPGAARGES